jgi:hypothetical protein
MTDVLACPFCRELFAQGERNDCPSCGIALKPLAELPPSHDAALLDEPLLRPAPEDEPLPWTFAGRGRGALVLVAAVGALLFFAPWLHERSPEIRTLSGMEFARVLPWIWGGGVGWFVMLPLVASRRNIRQMRGARVAVGFLAATVLMTVVARLVIQPRSHPLVPLRFAWGWGLYAAGCMAALALVIAARFGGSVSDMPSTEERAGDEPIH